VQLIYDCKAKSLIAPKTLDLSTTNDKIVAHESFEAWKIDPSKWHIASNYH